MLHYALETVPPEGTYCAYRSIHAETADFVVPVSGSCLSISVTSQISKIIAGHQSVLLQAVLSSQFGKGSKA
jgi:hypothetical protein